MDRPTKPKKRARLLHALKTGFSGAYDSIGFVITVSLICFVLVTAVSLAGVRIVQLSEKLLGVTIGVGLVLSSLSVWIVLIGAVFYATAKAKRKSADFMDATAAIRDYAGIAVRLYSLDMLVWFVLLGDLFFFLRMASGSSSLLFTVIGVVFGYLAIMWAMMTVYHLPLMAAYDRPPSEIRVLAIVRDSFVLMGGSPGFTACVFLAIIALGCLCAIPMLVGMALVYAGTAVFIAVFALHELFIRFGIIEEDAETVEEKPWKLPDDKRDSNS